MANLFDDLKVFLLFSNFLLLFIITLTIKSVAMEIIRDYNGDIFILPPEICPKITCNQSDRFAASISQQNCKCQCDSSHQIFREDLKKCINNITDCALVSFVQPYITETIPVVFLPTMGQLIHPDAQLTFTEKFNLSNNACSVQSSQIMSTDGWKLINESERLFELVQNGLRIFLRWIGNDEMRSYLKQKLVLARFICKSMSDFSRSDLHPCAAMRIGGVPGVSDKSINTTKNFLSNSASEKSNINSNYLIIGISLGLLGLTYVLSVLIYVRFKKSESLKNHSYLSDTLFHQTGSFLSKKTESSGKVPFKNDDCYIDSAMIVNEKNSNNFLSKNSCLSTNSSPSSSSSTFSPSSQVDPFKTFVKVKKNKYHSKVDENVTIVQVPEKVSEKSLNIDSNFLEPDFLASFPNSTSELLQKLREVIALAKKRLASFRFKPTLLVIPEDDYFYQESDSNQNDQQIKPFSNLCKEEDDNDSCFHENQEQYLELSDDQTSIDEDENFYEFKNIIKENQSNYEMNENFIKCHKTSKKEMILRINQDDCKTYVRSKDVIKDYQACDFLVVSKVIQSKEIFETKFDLIINECKNLIVSKDFNQDLKLSHDYVDFKPKLNDKLFKFNVFRENKNNQWDDNCEKKIHQVFTITNKFNSHQVYIKNKNFNQDSLCQLVQVNRENLNPILFHNDLKVKNKAEKFFIPSNKCELFNKMINTFQEKSNLILVNDNFLKSSNELGHLINQSKSIVFKNKRCLFISKSFKGSQKRFIQSKQANSFLKTIEYYQLYPNRNFSKLYKKVLFKEMNQKLRKLHNFKTQKIAKQYFSQNSTCNEMSRDVEFHSIQTSPASNFNFVTRITI